jgi:hypothetical protein
MAELQICIAFDIKDNRPHKAVRVYTNTGRSLGYGEMQISKVPESGDLFEKVPGSVTYLVDMNMEELEFIFNKAKNGVKEIKTNEEKTSDIDVPNSDDPAEDEWVRKALFQLKEAKAKIDIFTVENLRKDYKMMITKKKAIEDKPKEVKPEFIQATEYQLPDTVDKEEDAYVRTELLKFGKFKIDDALNIIKKLREDYRRNKLASDTVTKVLRGLPTDEEHNKVFDLDAVWDTPPVEKKEEPKKSLNDLLKDL